MTTLTAKPYLPIPSGFLPDSPYSVFAIRPLMVVFRPKFGPAVDFATESAHVALVRFRNAATNGESVVHMAQDGLDLDAESVAALNCYLRTPRAMGRMKLPFDRLPDQLAAGVDTRYRWASFCEHLGLNFR